MIHFSSLKILKHPGSQLSCFDLVNQRHLCMSPVKPRELESFAPSLEKLGAQQLQLWARFLVRVATEGQRMPEWPPRGPGVGGQRPEGREVVTSDL